MNPERDTDRFQQLWRRCLLDQAIDNSATIHQHLIDAYSEPQRVYHTLHHIRQCLSQLDKIRSLLQNADAVELAIWFHDVIYQPGAADNEQLSANQFMEMTNGLFDEALRSTVSQHVMATLHSGADTDNPDTKFMVDIDLSSFGLPWPRFLSDSKCLREEMSYLPDEIFYRKQFEFQRNLLEQSRFFKSNYFYDNYENQARKNLADYFALHNRDN